MENQTRFDLNAAIENWRAELAAQTNLTADDRRELETHLRDTISELRQRGLNDEETFWLARRRIGQPQQLGEEFVKVDPAKIWRERVFWVVLIYFLLGTLGNIPRFLSVLFSSPDSTIKLPANILVNLLSLSPIIVAVLLCVGKMPRQFSKLIGLIDERFRLALVALALILTSSILQYFTEVLSERNWELLLANAGMKYFHHGTISNEGILYPVAALLVLVALLIWLMPPQNRKTPKRA